MDEPSLEATMGLIVDSVDLNPWQRGTIQRIVREQTSRAVAAAVDAERARQIKFLEDVDSVCSLVAHRGLDAQSKEDLKRLSTLARNAVRAARVAASTTPTDAEAET